jgi:hypothetical protein
MSVSAACTNGLTKFEYKMKWKMMLIAMFFLLHFSEVEGRGFGQWRLSMRFSMLVDLLSTCNTLFIWIHTLDKNIRIKLG